MPAKRDRTIKVVSPAERDLQVLGEGLERAFGLAEDGVFDDLLRALDDSAKLNQSDHV